MEIQEIKNQIQKMSTLLQETTEKLKEVQSTLDHEREIRKKITSWIKEKIGTDLEHIKDLIDARNLELIEGVKQLSGNTTAKERRISTSENKQPMPTRKYSTPSKGTELDPTHTSTKQRSNSNSSSSVSTTSATSTTSTSTKSTTTQQNNSKRIIVDNPILEKYEEKAFGHVPLTTLEHNAVLKFNKPNRLKFFLTQQGHSTAYYGSQSLIEKVDLFTKSGGKFLIMPFRKEDLERDNFKFGIQYSDECFPVCPDGFFRSQMLYLVLRGIKRVLGYPDNGRVHYPHATHSGLDPIDPSSAALSENPHKMHYKFISDAVFARNDGEYLDNFARTFSQKLSKRAGEDTNEGMMFKKYCDGKDLQAKNSQTTMHDHFSLYYYGKFSSPENDNRRKIFFAFGSSVPIVLERLLENNNTLAELENVHVIAIPFGTKDFTENISRMKLYSIYQEYASFFVPLINQNS